MLQFALFLCACFGLSYSLDLRSVQEGSCRRIPAHQTLPAQDVDPNWLDTLHYVSAGSKYHLYRHASIHPRFREMREFEFQNEACYVKNTSIVEGNGSLFGFGGRILGSYNVRLARGGKDRGVIEVSITSPRREILTQRVSLTDYRTFAVVVQCWEGVDQRSWDVFSLTPDLDRRTQRLIENHVESLGFNRENFVFLNYKNCRNLEGSSREYGEPSPTRPDLGYQSGSLKRRTSSGSLTLKDSQYRDHLGLGGINYFPKSFEQGSMQSFGTPKSKISIPTRSGSDNRSRGLGWSSS